MSGQRLLVDVAKGEGGAVDICRLSGLLDEDASFELERIRSRVGPSVSINFNELTGINSAGTRAWLTFFRTFVVGRTVAFEECTPDVVAQVNMVPAFAEGARVVSVYAPYKCPDCRRDFLVLFKEGTYPKSPDELRERACDHCGTAAEFVGGQEYFVFAEDL